MNEENKKLRLRNGELLIKCSNLEDQLGKYEKEMKDSEDSVVST